MASVKSSLVRKLKEVLTRRFPPPATVRLDDEDGIFGVVTSTAFSRMETMDRQKLIEGLLATNFTPEERRRVLIIVAVTPDEGTGYLAGPD
jgi:hypothetical protein